MQTPGKRLKAERERLGMSQAAFRAVAGVGKSSQISYESDERSPDVQYLAAVAPLGVDVNYVVTGTPTPPAVGSVQDELLRRFNAASPEIRTAVMSVLGVTSAVAQTSTGPVFNGGIHSSQVLTGDVHQGDVTFHVGGKKKGPKK
ncbi:MAG: helix-turn-helix domain-containing protein [Lysobacter sp.]